MAHEFRPFNRDFNQLASMIEQACSHEQLGFQRFEIDDHHSGCHCPEGSLIIYNSKTARAEKDTVNYLEYAPALLAHFGVPRADYMMEPSFRF